MTCTVDLSPAQSIEITNEGQNWVIEGQDYDPSDIGFKLVYENGAADEIALNAKGVNINTTKVDVTTPGLYNVEVSYTLTETLFNVEVENTYKATYTVEVEQLDDITLETNVYTSGTYKNNTAQQVYLANSNSALNQTYLIVHAHTTTLDGSADHILTSGYTSDAATAFSTATEGVQTITYT